MMREQNVTFWMEGFIGDAWKISEKRDGQIEFIWKGYFDGGNCVKCFPFKNIGLYDGIKRKPMTLAVNEIKRSETF